MNSYLEIALRSGIIGLSLFVGLFIVILARLWIVAKSDRYNRMGYGNYARGSAATLLAILVTIATVSTIDFIPFVYWSFAGLCVAIVRVSSRQRVAEYRADVSLPQFGSVKQGVGLVGIASAVSWRDRSGPPGGVDRL